MLCDGGGFGVPVTMLSLVKRAQHSNFTSCAKCDQAKERWLKLRMGNRSSTSHGRHTFAELQELKAEIFQHVNDSKTERIVAMQLNQDAAAAANQNFLYHDKCGSGFLHQPQAPNSRDRGAAAGNWQYRWAMQGNLYDGELLRFSLVPPCLHTGARFKIVIKLMHTHPPTHEHTHTHARLCARSHTHMHTCTLTQAAHKPTQTHTHHA